MAGAWFARQMVREKERMLSMGYRGGPILRVLTLHFGRGRVGAGVVDHG